jgi:5-formyltetrahydrofolate cyclo-ligase
MKDSIRDKNIKIRNALNPGFIKEAGEGILLSFLSSGLISYKGFMVYYPVRNEAPVFRIIKYLLNNNKNIYMPHICDDDNLEMLRFHDFKDMAVGKYKIPEPSGHEIGNSDDVDVVMVPGIAFDRKGGRIGYGKGCYDKFLNGKACIKAGICYEFQIISGTLPGEGHDVEMDCLLTEKGFYEV